MKISETKFTNYNEFSIKEIINNINTFLPENALFTIGEFSNTSKIIINNSSFINCIFLLNLTNSSANLTNFSYKINLKLNNERRNIIQLENSNKIFINSFKFFDSFSVNNFLDVFIKGKRNNFIYLKNSNFTNVFIYSFFLFESSNYLMINDSNFINVEINKHFIFILKNNEIIINNVNFTDFINKNGNILCANYSNNIKLFNISYSNFILFIIINFFFIKQKL